MKPIIIAIVGDSGSGKTYMAEFLQNQLNVPTIVSYTTRPKRTEETDGVEHYFIYASQVPDKKDMLAYTRFGGHEYFALHKQVPGKGVCSYVIDEKGLETLCNNYCERYDIVSVLIICSQDTLSQRGIDSNRLKRDKGRKHLGEKFFDCIIHNDASKEEFEYKILCEFNRL